MLYLLLRRPTKPGKKSHELTEREVDELVREWRPEPLEDPALVPKAEEKVPVVLSRSPDGHAQLEGGRDVINFTSQDFFGVSTEAKVDEECTSEPRPRPAGARIANRLAILGVPGFRIPSHLGQCVHAAAADPCPDVPPCRDDYEVRVRVLRPPRVLRHH